MRAGHCGFNETGRYGVNGNIVSTDSLGQGLGQRMKASFCRTVAHLASFAPESAPAAYVNDHASPLLAHHLNGGEGGGGGADEIGIDGILKGTEPLVKSHASVYRMRAEDTGVVDEDV